MSTRCLLMLSWVLSAPAVAAEHWAESAPVATQQDAVRLRDALDIERLVAVLDDPDIAARVQRRFLPGHGWRYVLRVDGVDDLDASRTAAEHIAALGTEASVWTREGELVERQERVAPKLQPVTPDRAPVLDADRGQARQARQVLRQAAKAHRGSAGGLEVVSNAASLRFAYERRVELDDGALVASNRYLRSGDAMRLEVQVVEGDGVDSLTVLTPENRAFVVADGPSQARDPARTSEVLARFSPEVVLAIPLGVARDLEGAAAWQEVELEGEVELDSGIAVRLRPSGPPPTRDGLVTAAFDRASNLLVEVEWLTASGLMRFEFDDYRAIADDLIIPFSTRIHRDGRLVETIRVQELALEPALEGALFAAP